MKSVKRHVSWMGLKFNYEEGKGGSGAGKKKTPGRSCPFAGGLSWAHPDALSKPLSSPVESTGPGRSRKVVLYAVYHPRLSLVDICHHVENGVPGVAEGNVQPVSSEREKMHLQA